LYPSLRVWRKVGKGRKGRKRTEGQARGKVDKKKHLSQGDLQSYEYSIFSPKAARGAA
jgi:hypothetical protein